MSHIHNAQVSAQIITPGVPVRLFEHRGWTVTGLSWCPAAFTESKPTETTTILVEAVAADDGARTTLAGPVEIGTGTASTDLPLDGAVESIATEAGTIEVTFAIADEGRHPAGSLEITRSN